MRRGREGKMAYQVSCQIQILLNSIPLTDKFRHSPKS